MAGWLKQGFVTADFFQQHLFLLCIFGPSATFFRLPLIARYFSLFNSMMKTIYHRKLILATFLAMGLGNFNYPGYMV